MERKGHSKFSNVFDHVFSNGEKEEKNVRQPDNFREAEVHKLETTDHEFLRGGEWQEVFEENVQEVPPAAQPVEKTKVNPPVQKEKKTIPNDNVLHEKIDRYEKEQNPMRRGRNEPDHAGNAGDKGVEDRRNNIFLAFVLDRSYSFSKVFAAVYSTLDKVVHELDLIQKDGHNRQVAFYYGLVWFDGQSAEAIHFGSGKRFTEDYKEFLGRVKGLVLEGGSFDGYENVNEGIRTALDALREESGPCDNRGLLMFTDSMPNPDDRKPDFNPIGNGAGLRFAVTCVNEHKNYDPDFDIVDSENVERSECEKRLSISKLNGEGSVDAVKNIIVEITRKTSISL